MAAASRPASDASVAPALAQAAAVAQPVHNGRCVRSPRPPAKYLLPLLLAAFHARAAEVHTALGVSVGVVPAAFPNGVVGVRADVESEGEFTPFLAATLTGVVIQVEPLAVIAVDLGVRWHPRYDFAVGLSGALGLALLSSAGSEPRPVAGLTVEPARYTLGGHHELGVSLAVLWPLTQAPVLATGPYLSMLMMPKVTWAYRF